MRIVSIIGANYGDEGKGNITNRASISRGRWGENCLVVRFNGGAQAGHTVCTIDKKKHVFGHFGSGTFATVPTYLSEFFIVNPLLFRKEYNELRPKLKQEPIVFINSRAIVTTPIDMIINRIVEELRTSRHGSCGAGIHHTILRNTKTSLGFRMADLYKTQKIISIMKALVTKEYLQSVLNVENLAFEKVKDRYLEYLNNQNIIANFFDDIEFLCAHTTSASVLPETGIDTIIMEGAQGLLLDQNNITDYPYVTHSNTGLKNIREMEKTVSANIKETIYVSRWYLTRHGEGPFSEQPDFIKKYPMVNDNTNVYNPWQGNIRFGYLDIDKLRDRIKNDSNDRIPVLALTCLDQIHGFYIEKEQKIPVISDGKLKNLKLNEIQTHMGMYIFPIAGPLMHL